MPDSALRSERRLFRLYSVCQTGEHEISSSLFNAWFRENFRTGQGANFSDHGSTGRFQGVTDA